MKRHILLITAMILMAHISNAQTSLDHIGKEMKLAGEWTMTSLNINRVKEVVELMDASESVARYENCRRVQNIFFDVDKTGNHQIGKEGELCADSYEFTWRFDIRREEVEGEKKKQKVTYLTLMVSNGFEQGKKFNWKVLEITKKKLVVETEGLDAKGLPRMVTLVFKKTKKIPVIEFGD